MVIIKISTHPCHPINVDWFSLGWSNIYIRGFTKFGIKVAWGLQFLGYLRTLRLKFQKARTKIGVFLGLPCWLSQFKLKVLKYSRNCISRYILVAKVWHPLKYILKTASFLYNLALQFTWPKETFLSPFRTITRWIPLIIFEHPKTFGKGNVPFCFKSS